MSRDSEGMTMIRANVFSDYMSSIEQGIGKEMMVKDKKVLNKQKELQKESSRYKIGKSPR